MQYALTDRMEGKALTVSKQMTMYIVHKSIHKTMFCKYVSNKLQNFQRTEQAQIYDFICIVERMCLSLVLHVSS